MQSKFFYKIQLNWIDLFLLWTEFRNNISRGENFRKFPDVLIEVADLIKKVDIIRLDGA